MVKPTRCTSSSNIFIL